MAVIRINASGSKPVLHGSPAPLEACLDRMRETEGPAVIMIHGFKYLPGHPRHCPHRHILSLDPGHPPWHTPSWPRQLGFGLGRSDEGLGVAFGWNARGSLRRAQASARSAGRALASLICSLRAMDQGRPVHLIAHSLGTEVALEALHHLPPGAVQRIVSLTGASYQARAREALATPAGRSTEFFNITSGENDAFDFLFEWIAPPPERGSRAIGSGLDLPNAVTLQLDCQATLAHLEKVGFPLAMPERLVCHWSAYMRPGALRLYRALLREPGRVPLALLKEGLPAAPARRWTRLFALRPAPAPLPIWQRI